LSLYNFKIFYSDSPLFLSDFVLTITTKQYS